MSTSILEALGQKVYDATIRYGSAVELHLHPEDLKALVLDEAFNYSSTFATFEALESNGTRRER